MLPNFPKNKVYYFSKNVGQIFKFKALFISFQKKKKIIYCMHNFKICMGKYIEVFGFLATYT